MVELVVSSLQLRNFRSYERLTVELPTGLTVLHGPVGAGKTNLLEALHFVCVGRSFRTSNDRELVRFGQSACHVSARTQGSGRERLLEVGLEPGHGKVAKADGARADRLADTEGRPLLSVFSPDRLELVKGPAGGRRAHLDDVVASLWPARRGARRFFVRALAQRNSLIGRVRGGHSPASALGPWTREVARHGFELMQARAAAVAGIDAAFGSHAEALGLPLPATIEYRPRSKAEGPEGLERELEDRIDTDLERGFTTHGPHRDELVMGVAGRDLRRYGSQGQQRLGLLALLLAEWQVLTEQRSAPPLLLLDDVMSELDPDRRSRLLEVVASGGQTLITTADPGVVERSAGVTLAAVTAGSEVTLERAA